MSENLVSQFELARIIAKDADSNMVSLKLQSNSQVSKSVLKVITTIGKFMSHIFTKNETPITIAEIPAFG